MSQFGTTDQCNFILHTHPEIPSFTYTTSYKRKYFYSFPKRKMFVLTSHVNMLYFIFVCFKSQGCFRSIIIRLASFWVSWGSWSDFWPCRADILVHYGEFADDTKGRPGGGGRGETLKNCVSFIYLLS